MADNEDFKKEAEAKIAADKKADADKKAKQKAARDKVKQQADQREKDRLAGIEAEAKAAKEKAAKDKAEREKKQAEQSANRDKGKATQAEADKKRIAQQEFNNARDRAKAAAERAARTGRANDDKVYQNALAEYNKVKASYVSEYGAVPSEEIIVAPKPQLAPTQTPSTAATGNTATPNPQNVGPQAAAITNPNRKEWANPVVGAAAMTTTDPNLQRIIQSAAKAGIDLSVAQAQAQLDSTAGGGGGGGSTRSVTQYSMQQVRSAADNIFQQSIGRSLNDEELRQLHVSLNGALKASPVISSASGTSGGVDERGFIQQEAEMNPEFANYQMGTTYFDTMLKSLSGPVGGGI